MDSFELFGSSPSTVTALALLEYQAASIRKEIPQSTKKRWGLNDFIAEIPQKLALRKEAGIPAGSKHDPVMEMFERINLKTEEWKPYALKDSSRHYTRNLIATDDQTYTLLLLCWNPGHHSPIHDHPCDGCWMKVLQGQIQECRYRPEGDSQRLVCTQDTTQTQDDIVYIEDSMGFHKVGNPHPTETAYTLHLYSPPIQSCKIWLNETMACECELQNYSAYGKKLE